MKILIAEDDVNKLAVLRQFLTEIYPSVAIEVARSYQSAKELIQSPGTDLALLDMQLPQFDKNEREEGGRRQSLAGMELLRQMKRRDIRVPSIVVTQFRDFGSQTEAFSLSDLTQRLAEMKVPGYMGLVYYNPKIENWKKELEMLITSALKK